MDVFLSVIAVVFLLGVLYVLRKKKPSSGKRPDADRPASSGDTTFHAVSIVYAQGACKAAFQLEGRRFLSSAAPRLPLPDCDVLECKCRFAHHDDRRKGDDRRNPYMQTFGGVGSGTGQHAEEQRQQSDRRKEPPDAF